MKGFHLPSVLDVLVNEAGNAHGYEGEVPAGHEHDGQAQAKPEHRQSPAKSISNIQDVHKQSESEVFYVHK